MDALAQQRPELARQSHQSVGRYIQSGGKACAADIHKTPRQILSVGKGRAVQHEIQGIGDGADLLGGRHEARIIADIQGDHVQSVDLLCQGLDATAQPFALIGEEEARPLGVGGLGNAPGDASSVGDTSDEAAAASHERSHPWGVPAGVLARQRLKRARLAALGCPAVQAAGALPHRAGAP